MSNFRSFALVMVVFALVSGRCYGDLLYHVDFDAAPGIQNSTSVAPGDLITATIVMELTGTTSISAYSFTVGFDTDALSFVSGTESPPPGLDTNLQLINNDFFGQIRGVEYVSFGGGGPTGPATFEIAELTFNAFAPDLDFAPDIWLFERAIVDASADASSVVLTPTFGFGVVTNSIPEASSLLYGSALFALGFSWHRRRKRIEANSVATSA